MASLLEQLRNPTVEAEAVIAGALLAGLGLFAVLLSQSCGRAEATCSRAEADCRQVLNLIPHF